MWGHLSCGKIYYWCLYWLCKTRPIFLHASDMQLQMCWHAVADVAADINGGLPCHSTWTSIAFIPLWSGWTYHALECKFVITVPLFCQAQFSSIRCWHALYLPVIADWNSQCEFRLGLGRNSSDGNPIFSSFIVQHTESKANIAATNTTSKKHKCTVGVRCAKTLCLPLLPAQLAKKKNARLCADHLLTSNIFFGDIRVSCQACFLYLNCLISFQRYVVLVQSVSSATQD